VGRPFRQDCVLELAVLSRKDLLCSLGEDQLKVRTGMGRTGMGYHELASDRLWQTH